MSDVIADAVTMLDSMAATSARLRAVLTVLGGSEDGDQRAARRLGRQEVEQGFKVLLSVLQPDIGRALTARGAWPGLAIPRPAHAR